MAKYDLLIKLDTTMDPEIVDYYKNYKPKYEEDSGFDLPAPLDVVIFQKPCGSIDFKISALLPCTNCCNCPINSVTFSSLDCDKAY